MLGLLAGLASQLFGQALWSSLIGWIGPLTSSIVSLGGAIISAIAEIIIALSKSPEGRIFLALIVVAGGLCFGRWHYLEQGRAEGLLQMEEKVKAVKCPATTAPRTRY